MGERAPDGYNEQVAEIAHNAFAAAADVVLRLKLKPDMQTDVFSSIAGAALIVGLAGHRNAVKASVTAAIIRNLLEHLAKDGVQATLVLERVHPTAKGVH